MPFAGELVGKYGPGTVGGLLVGIFFAEWVDPPTEEAYSVLVVLSLLVCVSIGRVFYSVFKKIKGPKDNPADPPAS